MVRFFVLIIENSKEKHKWNGKKKNDILIQ